jgi:hypothetical protein
MQSAAEVAALIRTKCLTDSGREAPKKKLSITAKDSPYRAEIEQEIAEVEARWESEAPVRATRAALAAAGWELDLAEGVCRKKITPGKPKIKKSLIEAIRAAGLGV